MQLRFTAPAKPCCELTVQVLLPLLFFAMLRRDGLQLMLKSGTRSAMLKVRVSDPPAP